MAAGRKMKTDDFHASLVLVKWAKSFFAKSLEAIGKTLNEEALEGFDASSEHTKFYQALRGNYLFSARADEKTFAEYDRNVVRHWRAITEKREANGEPLRMKYFQYLALLLTEVYLDWTFNHAEALIAELNELVSGWNKKNPKAELAAIKDASELRKVSYWMATGAGKTLLMHVNVRQYLAYAHAAGKSPSRVIVLTPTEGLARQHLRELKASGFAASELKADMMAAGVGDVTGEGVVNVGVIDSGKLISDKSAKKAGEKSLMASAFEGENLVLVDEGHHGASAADSEHRAARDQLCKDGFSFEYSATFGQAVASGGASVLRSLYAKNILFDYSYRYFHDDGYGKEAFILNMPDDEDGEQVFRYLCANLLAFHQQRALWRAKPEAMEAFGVASPLCVFVGHTVNADAAKGGANSAAAKVEASDVARIVGFFADVLARRGDVEKLFEAFVADEDVLKQKGGRNPLWKRYDSNVLAGRTGSEIYEEMLRDVFNTDHVESLKVQYEKGTGEITLSVADGRVFGLLSIGDAAGFMKRVEGLANVTALEKEIGGTPRFDSIDEPGNEITMLVGSRKFTEGWSSWRVSAMGLLNMGVNEGAQVIQFFGRGVRLRGRGLSLKRSTETERTQYAPGAGLTYLETLQIFGVRANYMAKFREYLERDGVTTQDAVLTVEFSIKPRFAEARKKLRVMRVRGGYGLGEKKGFRTQRVELFDLPAELKGKVKDVCVEYDDYGAVESMATDGGAAGEATAAEVKIGDDALSLFDWDRVYRALEREKARAGYWNLAIDKARLVKFAREGKKGWYRLIARPGDVAFTDFAHLRNAERIFTKLVCEYMRRFYETARAAYEGAHSAWATLPEDWLPQKCVAEFRKVKDEKTGEWRLTEDALKWKEKIEKLRDIVASGDITEEQAVQESATSDGLFVIAFRRHLYAPIVFVKDGEKLPVTIKPTLLDAESERQFVEDLEQFCKNQKNGAMFEGVDLYLLRNDAHGEKGIGFAQAGNFHPDFLLWIVEKATGRQHLTFVDPKGMLHEPFESPKVNFAKEVKKLEAQLNAEREAGEPEVLLESVILSETPSEELESHFGVAKEEWEAKHVFFMEDGQKSDHAPYIRKLLQVAKGVEK